MNPEQEHHLFEDLDEFLKRFIILSDNDIALIRTYFIRTYFSDVFEIGAILRITSAKMRSGKSQVRRLAKLLCKNGFSVTAPTAPSLWTIIDSQDFPPCIGINEADRMFERDGKDLADIVATLDASVTRGELVPRTLFKEGGKRDIEWLPTYSNIILDGIDNRRTPDTVEDRAITIRMKRRRSTQHVEKLRETRLRDEVSRLKERMQAFYDENKDKINLYPDLPDGLNDREEDKFETLVSVADVAGVAYGAGIREAILANSKATDGGVEEDNDIELLENIREVLPNIVYDTIDNEKVYKGENILNAVKVINIYWQMNDGREPKSLTELSMAKLLSPHGITTKKFRQLNNKRRYKDSNFQNIFKEVLDVPVSRIPATPALPATKQVYDF
jgi:hypothetical protein